MNLVEFALTAITERPDPDHLTFEFPDQVYDQQTGTLISQKLAVTFSPKYGPPNATDRDVLLVLVQLTHQHNGWQSPTVRCPVREALTLLRWAYGGSDYNRLKLSMKRWHAAVLNYQRAWWDKDRDAWVDLSLHVLDSVKFRKGRGQTLEQQETTFTWSPEFFRRCNLKTLDWNFYISLHSPITKAAYRLLDKRFHRKPHVEFDLHSFAFTKIGLSRNYNVAQIKRRLAVLAELEERGYCTAPSYPKLGPGQWKIAFDRIPTQTSHSPRKSGTSQTVTPQDPLVSDLVKRNLTLEAAHELVATFPAARIRLQIEIHDWLLQRQDKRIGRNPPGWLVAAIRSGFSSPTGFESAAQREERRKRDEALKAQHLQTEQESEHQLAEARAKELAPILAYLEVKTPDEHAQLQEQAIAQGTPFEQKAARRRHGPVAQAIRENLLHRYVAKLLAEQEQVRFKIVQPVE